MNVDELFASPEGKTLEFRRDFSARRLSGVPRKSRLFFLVKILA